MDKSQAVAGATGSTALHVACANGCTKIVDLLLRNGAKINVRDKYGSRPIDVAAAKNHVEIVRLLETFEKMQVMLKGLQEGQKRHQLVEEVGRRSMDATLFHQQQEAKKKEKIRRPSLPSVFDSSSKLEIPDISTLPSRQSLNTPRPSVDELAIIHPYQQKYYIQNGKRHYYSTSPETDTTPTEKGDWYSHGVVKNHDEDENYLTSLERRAYGLSSPTNTPTSYFSEKDDAIVGRASLDTYRRTSFDAPPIKRCSSVDGGRLRTTALMNAMAANTAPVQDDDDSLEDEPRPSLYEDSNRPTDLEQPNNKKKFPWFNNNADTGRKSVDAVYSRPSLERSRTSMDFRPSLDSLSQFAKKSFDGLSRKSIDTTTDSFVDEPTKSGRGFLSRWWTNSTTADTVSGSSQS